MFIGLHHQYSGKKIIEAFRSASTFMEAPNKQWKPDEFIDKFQYEPGSIKQTIRSQGVNTSPFFFRKKWRLFGEKAWKDAKNPVFTLEPLVLTKSYDAIEISVKYVYETDQFGFDWTATSPHSPEFENIRPQFEKILDRFFSFLQSSPT